MTDRSDASSGHATVTPGRVHGALAVALVVVIVGCTRASVRGHQAADTTASSPPVASATSVVSSSATTTAEPASSVAPTTALDGSPECTSAQIAVTFVGTEGAGGTFGLAAFTVKARTAMGCSTSGYPGVQLFNNGHPLPNVVKRGPGDLTHAGPPQTVTLTGTQTGSFDIEYLRGANGATCPAVTSVGIIAPNQRQQLSLATPTVGVPFTPCGDVTVTPIQANPAP